MIVVMVLSVVLLGGSLLVYVGSVQGARERNARTALSNCEQIEELKGQARGLLADGLKRLPEEPEYEGRPEALAQAIKRTENAIARFAEDDCYQLPVVKNAGLTRP